MRRYVNMAKSGRMAATRRVPPAAPRSIRKEDPHTAGKGRIAVRRAAGRRRA